MKTRTKGEVSRGTVPGMQEKAWEGEEAEEGGKFGTFACKSVEWGTEAQGRIDILGLKWLMREKRGEEP